MERGSVTRRRFARLALVAIVAAGGAGASVSAAAPSTVAIATPMTPPIPGTWAAVLVAGDDSVVAFDNGVNALAAQLQARGVGSAVLTTSGGGATHAGIDASLGAVSSYGSTGCFFYVTSHGTEAGVQLSGDAEPLLTPDELTDMLRRGCGKRPTYVVISACHSGTFLTDAMRGPFTAVITAARTDRSSFGCSDDTEYTYFDGCFLEHFPQAVDWTGLYNAVSACVSDLEAQTGMSPPSEPQFHLGAGMAAVPLPGG